MRVTTRAEPDHEGGTPTRRATRSKILWTVWMSGGAIALAALGWALTGSPVWALVALVAAGPVLNTVAQMVVRPADAIRRAARPDEHVDRGTRPRQTDP